MTLLDKLRGDKMPVPARPHAKAIALAWLGCSIAIGLLAWLHLPSERVLLIASFGASCLLVFGFPEGVFSQPRNVVLGHVVSSLIGLVFLQTCGPAWWALALAAATAMAVMMWLRIVHPPAGANPVIVFLTTPSWDFLLTPTLMGAVLIVLVALIYNNTMRGELRYPKYW